MKIPAWVFPVVGAALLAGLFVLLKPDAEPSAGGAPAAPPATAAVEAPTVATPAPPAPRVFELNVVKGQLESGPAALVVRQGDEVVIRITSDHADSLHLHGYDLHAKLQPGVAAELRFLADRTGRFEYELHHAHAEIGALEVHPR